MPVFIDSLNRKIQLEQPPVKIISLVPSITELLYDLDLANNITGITKYCIKPENKPGKYQIIGGVENLNMDLIHKMNPDLIIASKEENTKSEITELAESFTVFITSIHNFDQAISMIFDIGAIVNKSEQANSLIKQISEEFDSLIKPIRPEKAVYLIWKNPYITVAGNTFIHDMILKAGYLNTFSSSGTKYPVIEIQDIKKQSPDVVFLSSEPYPFKEKDIIELKNSLPDTRIILVDGEMFSWYGSRMKYAPDYFKKLSLNTKT